MKAKSCMMMAVAAGAACSAFASGPQLDTASSAVLKGHVYVNARTGERTITTVSGTSRMGPGVFINEDTASNGNFFWGMDNPTATFPSGGQRIGGEGSDWGDLDFDTFIDGYTTAYATNVFAGTTSVPGYTLINWWYDCDNGFGDVSAAPVWGIGLSSIAGGDPTLPPTLFAGWIYTVDLAGTGIEFELGDTDGSFTGVLGGFTGCDKDDTDGNPKNDFGWSYIFVQDHGLPLGTCGPFLVLPASADIFEDDVFVTGATGNADGVDDAFDLYSLPNGFLREVYEGTLWFGGWVPGGGVPYASFYMGLYGGGGGDPCAAADYNGDTTVDILDFLDFFDDYGTCDGSPAPCGSFGDPDQYNPDGFVDILDFLGFFDIFGQCS